MLDHTGFVVTDLERARRFYEYCGAFVLDPDGNNIEACARGSAAA